MHEDIKPDNVRHNLQAKPIWLRLLYMILFVIFWGVAEIVLAVVVVFQFIYSFSGKTNENMRRLGQQLAEYVYQIIRFLTYNSEELPFPFAEWPEGRANARPGAPKPRRAGAKKTARKSGGGEQGPKGG